jgi:hypothetical protein
LDVGCISTGEDVAADFSRPRSFTAFRSKTPVESTDSYEMTKLVGGGAGLGGMQVQRQAG